MKVHYFYSRKNCGGWYDVKLEALMEEDVYSSLRQKNEKSFLYIEEIDVHINNNLREFQCAKFNISFGKDCSVDGTKSVAEMYRAKEKDTWENFIHVTRKQYERIRKVLFAIYEREKCMDFSIVKEKQKSFVRVLDNW